MICICLFTSYTCVNHKNDQRKGVDVPTLVIGDRERALRAQHAGCFLYSLTITDLLCFRTSMPELANSRSTIALMCFYFLRLSNVFQNVASLLKAISTALYI